MLRCKHHKLILLHHSLAMCAPREGGGGGGGEQLGQFAPGFEEPQNTESIKLPCFYLGGGGGVTIFTHSMYS